ncbi:MAG: SRPBCC family protein [Pseudomonadota bacterium]
MLKKVLGGIAIFLIAIVALGFVLPDKAHIEREIVINAPQEEVFTLISDFGEWDRWSPWAKLDPDAEYSYSGSGVGQRMEWTSEHPEVGNGAQEITALAEPSRVVTALDFGDMGQAEASFTLEPAEGGATRVVWSFDSNMRKGVPVHMKPVSTYMGFFMDGFLGPAYEEGLANLKREAEAG